MKRYPYLIFLIVVFYSCSELCEGECFEDRNISMRILSSIDSTDLVFGEDNVYDIEDLVVFSLSGVDSTIINLDTIYLGNPEIESYIIFDHNDFSISRVFIDYGNTDVDTLDVNFMSEDCCGYGNRFLDTATQNNAPVYSHNGGSTFVTLLK